MCFFFISLYILNLLNVDEHLRQSNNKNKFALKFGFFFCFKFIWISLLFSSSFLTTHLSPGFSFHWLFYTKIFSTFFFQFFFVVVFHLKCLIFHYSFEKRLKRALDESLSTVRRIGRGVMLSVRQRWIKQVSVRVSKNCLFWYKLT